MELPPYRPSILTAGGMWPRCPKCDSSDLRAQYERGGVLAYYGMTAADAVLDDLDRATPLTLPEHLVRSCGYCGYWWREALAVGS